MVFSVDTVIEKKMYIGMPVMFSSSKTRNTWLTIHNKTVVLHPETVAKQLTEAKEIIDKVSMDNILVLYDKGLYSKEVAELAKTAGFHYMNYRIPSGVLTNFSTLLQRINAMNELDAFVASDAFASLTKKEQVMKKRQLAKLQKVYEGVKKMHNMPQLVIIIDAMSQAKFLNEVSNLQISSIILTSSDFDRRSNIGHIVLLNTQSYNSIHEAVSYLLAG